MNLTPAFDARRMVNDYATKLYDPSHANWMWMEGGNFEEARSRARWNARVREVWPQVRFVDMGPAPSGPVMSGKPIPVHAALYLAGLRPEDVRVECLIGAISTGGNLEHTEVVPLPGVRMEGDDIAIFERDIIPAHTGRLGYAIRVSPNTTITRSPDRHQPVEVGRKIVNGFSGDSTVPCRGIVIVVCQRTRDCWLQFKVQIAGSDPGGLLGRALARDDRAASFLV